MSLGSGPMALDPKVGLALNMVQDQLSLYLGLVKSSKQGLVLCDRRARSGLSQFARLRLEQSKLVLLSLIDLVSCFCLVIKLKNRLHL